jgi:GT2 family glycosyltransferase
MTEFSVIINTYDRKQALMNCIERLEDQTYDDFEVIIVDQGNQNISHPEFKIIDSEDKGPAYGRNRGAEIAEGDKLAFTDDDCLPRQDWLEKAQKEFNDKLSGLEGRIETDKGPKNEESFERLHGFATANMFYAKNIFEKVGGFGEQIGAPPYREDTDLAWRIMEFGKIEYSEEVVVEHPPKEKEKSWKTYKYDVLLYSKHPENFIEFNKDLPIREIPRAAPGWILGILEFGFIPPIQTFIFARLKRKLKDILP